MKRSGLLGLTLLVGLALLAAPLALAQDTSKLNVGGVTYTKWLWGTQRDQGALYNFKDAPGEGYGDNGQGTEIYLLLDSKLSKAVSFHGAFSSRFYQNFWTNFGGFGQPNSAGNCIPNGCGEFDPRSDQYVKLRGATVWLTPGYSWVDRVTIGSNDFGMFDPFTIGRIRYIDRYNGSGILLQGSAAGKKVMWDATRISLPRLWAGPAYNTGTYHAQDASYGAQVRVAPSSMVDFGAIFNWVNDIEVKGNQVLIDEGRDIRLRFRNTVIGLKAGLHPDPKIDVKAAYYYSTAEGAKDLTPTSFGTSGFSPVPAGLKKDWSGKLNVDLNDPFGMGLSFQIEAFNIGADYVSMMAARRESDVLLTEGHDGTWAQPGPNNASFGVFGGNPTIIGYGGWDGPAHQVATVNVDNQFTDFDESMAESVIGWKGLTVAPTFSGGGIDLSGEYTYITYNTNWQAWGDRSKSITDSVYPNMESDAGLGHYRNAYAPFQDKTTHIGVARAKYVIEVGKGIELSARFKYLKETDPRMTDASFLPFKAGDCSADPNVGCKNEKNFYSTGNSTGDYFSNPPVITVNGVKGYQWKPFNSLDDMNRDLKMTSFGLTAGYQLTDDLYGSIGYNYWNADLFDGTTAFQAYNLHEMAGGKHKKNQLVAKAKYILAGAELGLEYESTWGTFDPDFGGGFIVQYADAAISNDHHVAVGSKGFSGRYGGWNSLESRDFSQQRLKAFLKVQF